MARLRNGYSLVETGQFADDATLVRHCLRNDPRAIRTLVEQFQDLVFGMCVRMLGHRHDAEDVTQEVFLRIFRSLRRGIRPGRSSRGCSGSR